MTDVTESQRDGVWAYPYQLASGQTQQHELGYTRLWVTLLDMEWQVRVQKLVPDTDPITWYEAIGHTLPSGVISEQRFVRTGDNGMVRYIPAMAPLPTVIKPHQPLTIPAGATCVIYVGTTLWMKICVGDSASELMELPLATPSMTWLGRNTMQGELCYASATYGRLALEAVPKRPWRALTPVTIINRRQKSLLVERFSLPTPLLPVYRNDKGRLWTPGVTVESDTDMNSANLHIESSVTAAAGPCELIAPAREQMARGRRLVRAFDHIFG